MGRSIHAVADWSDAEIDALLLRAGELADGAPPARHPDARLGMCFLQTSLRTRVGFEAAAQRLGATFVEASERRGATDSMPESVDDTVRVLSGYCDALVVRSPRPSADLREAARPGVSWFNAGDAGDHPSQALVDAFAIERLWGSIGDARIAVVGDLRMRAAHSLLDLLARRRPGALVIATDDALLDDRTPGAARRVDAVAALPDFDPDVVYVVGIPHQAVTEDVRTRLRLDRATIGRLGERTAVLSPLPLIDEVASNVRSDPRVRWYEQSDLALHVRVAILESLLAG
jgi:aspartate carbamoyltransferase catalytic subunit